MKYSDQKPPNWDKLVELFKVDWKNTVVTYGDTVHSIKPVTPDLDVHEAVHERQQAAYGVEAWWERYYVDQAFRLEQEIEAYRAQFLFLTRNTADRNLIFRVQDHIARDLAGPQYGRCITYHEAFAKIGQRQKVAA